MTTSSSSTTKAGGESLFATDADRLRLQAFFEKTPDANTSSRWDDIWKEDFLPFDRGVPNPALDEALEKYVPGAVAAATSSSTGGEEATTLPSPIIQDPSTGQQRRRAALVPGCGRGYDVLLLAAYGYDAVGLEISETAVLAAGELATRVEKALGAGVVVVEGQGEKADAGTAAVTSASGLTAEQLAAYRTRDEGKVGRGTARFAVGDFFGADPSTWAIPENSPRRAAEEAVGPLPARYDVVVDYTFLCAFPPSQRPRWAAAMRRILATARDSRLVCVEFPTYKDPNVRGPPWAMQTRTYLAVLGRPGEEPSYDEEKRVVISDEDVKTLEEGRPLTPDGMIRVAHYKCSRTHPVGKDTDHLGIWRRAKDP